MLCRFTTADKLLPDIYNPQALNRYAYCLNNPLIYTDSSGNFFETIWDLYSVGSGAYSMTKNIMKGNWVDASIDAGGVVLDMGAAIVPFVPAVGSTSIKAGRKIVKGVAKNADKAADVSKASEVGKAVRNTAGDASKKTLPNTTKGWKVGEPINNLTSKGNVPKWNTVRQRYWKNEALKKADNYSPANVDRMKKGLAPQRINPKTGKVESMELHHTPPQRDGGLFDVKEVWPDQHGAIDPFRNTGG